jgi:hypothetical protein
MSPTALSRPTLCHLTPVRFPSGASVAHAIRREGTWHHDRLSTPTCGASNKYGHDVELSPSSSAGPAGPVQRGEGRRDPGSPFPPRSLSLSCNLYLPLTYIRGGRTPHDGGSRLFVFSPFSKDSLKYVHDGKILENGPRAWRHPR